MKNKKEKQMIPIVMAMDDFFVVPSYVAIWSLLENSSNCRFYDLFIIYAKGLSEKSRHFILQIEKKLDNCKIHFLQISEDIFANVSLKQGITVPTMFRLLIGDLLLEYEKCLYLDGDILILDDISKLYDIPIGDHYIGAVRDSGIQRDLPGNRNYAKTIGMDCIEDYFNAGVLIMNLTQIRESGMKEVFLSNINKKYLYLDQDILNTCCQGRVTYLPLKYNVFRRFYRRGNLLKNSVFSEEERKEAEEKMVILHYAEGIKPWENLRGVASDVWWEYAQKALPLNVYIDYRQRTEYLTKKDDYEGIIDCISLYDEVVIFGYSFYGREIFKILQNLGLKNVVAFCDNNEKKQGEVFETLEVKSFDQIKEQYSTPFFINASQRQVKQVAEFLYRNGYGKEHVWNYDHKRYRKTKLYYTFLDKVNYFRELQYIVLAEFGIWTETWDELFDFIKREENEFLIDKYYMKEWVLCENG